MSNTPQENWRQALREERAWTDGNRAGRKLADHTTRPTDPALARLYDLGVSACQGRPHVPLGIGPLESGGLVCDDLPALPPMIQVQRSSMDRYADD